ncbi:regulatory protein, luxR family [Pseudarcicella hirudinis]|uniref:Regulatory protein, luxR family n=2 Tax=Pseudarcicella hirudinis TaxID=1079859 RepID=A0A1I5RG05_9BACT|nr:regulatory protein, luxR family [Pseudarcicella hirudinis]
MIVMKSVLWGIIFSISAHILYAQNTIGLPEITNFSKKNYVAGTQNWGILQDKNGIMYFANNEGLLTFDGVFWKTYPLPNKSKVRSMAFGNDHKIYVGAEDEFGYFSPDKNGNLTYFSLKKLIHDKDSAFSDVWNICEYNGGLFFRASNKIFQYKDHSIAVYKPVSHWRFLGKSHDLLIAQDFDKGILQYHNGGWQPFLQNSALPSGALVTAFIPLEDGRSLLTTLEHGIYLIKDQTASPLYSPFLSLVSSHRIYSAVQVSPDRLALSTSLAGCYIINTRGEFIQKITKSEGLQNNNILSSFIDKNHNLWLGLDNGITSIAYNNAIKNIFPENDRESGGYTSALYNNTLYLGTSKGLYKVPVGANVSDLSYVTGKFSFVENSKGQVWNLSEINGKMLMAHHEGIFQVANNTAQRLLGNNGFWTFLPLSSISPAPVIVSGSYNGIHFLTYKNQSFQMTGAVPDFYLSSRFICIDNENTIWMSHPYRGVYRISVNNYTNASSKLYDSKNGLPVSLNNNYVYKVKNRIVVATEKGIYEYNHFKDRFEPSEYFRKLFKDIKVFLLKEDASGNIWFTSNNQLGVIDLSKSKPETVYFPELTNKMVSGFENITILNENNVLVGGETGFYHINYPKYKQNQNEISVQLRSLKAYGQSDSLIFGGYFGEVNMLKHQAIGQIPKISSQFNTLDFAFSSTLFSQQSSIEYAYFLEGFDNSWSGWTKKTEKEYSRLPYGLYRFQVKARNNFGKESAVASYSFEVLPPWYLTFWAYLYYAVLVGVLVYLAYKWQKRKFVRQQLKYREEQQKLQYLHQLELARNDKEIVRLKNEKLESEITHKNSDLASSAMHLVQKAEILNKIRTDLVKIARQTNMDDLKDDLKKMVKMVDEENKIDSDWGQFSVHFDKVHSNFLIALKEKYPNLSATELKLCAYLRMNLSTKEIAQLMNISSRSVEVSRYRLRKKLQLPSEINLFNFFLDFHVEENKS